MTFRLSVPYHIPDAWFVACAAAFELVPAQSLLSIQLVTGLQETNCARTMRVIGTASVSPEDKRSGRKSWQLAADWRARADAYLALVPEPSRPPKQVREAPVMAPTYASGDPHHFDVDWLGRVVYRGPTAKGTA